MPAIGAIVELRLPGLDGKMVSLPTSTPTSSSSTSGGAGAASAASRSSTTARSRQELGGKRLQVIGVACEKAATFEGRRDAAAAAAQKLGINYPVLVTSMDGACPVQRALQVQFYPSMVLLDREGNILQFEQGATDATLGRIDRAIAKAVDQSVDSRR